MSKKNETHQVGRFDVVRNGKTYDVIDKQDPKHKRVYGSFSKTVSHSVCSRLNDRDERIYKQLKLEWPGLVFYVDTKHGATEVTRKGGSDVPWDINYPWGSDRFVGTRREAEAYVKRAIRVWEAGDRG